MLDLTFLSEPDVARDKRSKPLQTEHGPRNTFLTAFAPPPPPSPRFILFYFIFKETGFNFYAHTLFLNNCLLSAAKLRPFILESALYKTEQL